METWQGYNIQVVPDFPKYVLPEEVCPGVPWPPGFRDTINTWSLDFLGTTCLLPDDQVYVVEGRKLVMNNRTYRGIQLELGKRTFRDFTNFAGEFQGKSK